MSLKIFILLFGALFAAGAGLFIIITKLVDGFKQYGKGPLIYLSLTSVFTGASVFLISFLSSDLFNSYVLFLIIFLLAGIIHVYIMYKNFLNKELNLINFLPSKF